MNYSVMDPKLLTMAGKINRCYYEEACMKK